MPILSILIPTYNRADKLALLFENILPLDSLICKNLLEIVVSNNASTDHTSGVVLKYQYLIDLRYYEQKSNLGFDGNVRFLYDVQLGDWSLLVGDDDFVENKSLVFLINKLIHSGSSTIYLLPSLAIHNGLYSPSWPKLCLDNFSKSYPQTLIFIISNGISRFGFIGCHIYPSRLTKSRLSLLSKSEFKYWTHLFFFLDALMQRYTLKYINVSVVSQNLDNSIQGYLYSRWALLYFQRLLGIIKLFKGNSFANKFFLLFLLLRETASVSMNKEFVRLCIIYSKTLKFRLRVLRRLCLKELSGSLLLFNIYYFFLFLLSSILCTACHQYLRVNAKQYC